MTFVRLTGDDLVEMLAALANPLRLPIADFGLRLAASALAEVRPRP